MFGIERIGSERVVVAEWPKTGLVARNWGDKLNPYVIWRLSGIKATHVCDVPSPKQVYVHCVIGSMLGFTKYENLVVWGAGFISAEQDAPVIPRAVFAVRGHLTAQKLRSRGIIRGAVPVGDPALLMPLIYTPRPCGEWPVGFIPHFRDLNLPIVKDLREQNRSDILLIDILGDIEQVCDQIKSCRVILSSSLHGLIAAHSYGVPALYVKLSDNPLGDGFKFFDYFSTIIGDDSVYTGLQTGSDLMRLARLSPQTPQLPDRARLIACCPFLSVERKQNLIEGARGLK